MTDLNGQAKQWVIADAGLRTHGTTRTQPLASFVLEKPLLRPLPAIVPDLGPWPAVRVHRDCHVQSIAVPTVESILQRVEASEDPPDGEATTG